MNNDTRSSSPTPGAGKTPEQAYHDGWNAAITTVVDGLEAGAERVEERARNHASTAMLAPNAQAARVAEQQSAGLRAHAGVMRQMLSLVQTLQLPADIEQARAVIAERQAGGGGHVH